MMGVKRNGEKGQGKQEMPRGRKGCEAARPHSSSLSSALLRPANLRLRSDKGLTAFFRNPVPELSLSAKRREASTN